MNSESVSKAFKLIDRRLLSDHSHRGIWEIIEKFGVERLGIFFLDKNEDINILVEFLPGKLNFDNYMDLKFYLEELIGERGNLITKDGIKPRFRDLILEKVEYL